MSCNFQDKCYNNGSICDWCMRNPKGTTLDCFNFNEEGECPTKEVLDAQLETDYLGSISECELKSICSGNGYTCDWCMRNPKGTTWDEFYFNGEGEESIPEELRLDVSHKRQVTMKNF